MSILNRFVQTLADCGLPNGKGDSIEHAAFTFDVFYKIYQTICPRTDIDSIFKSITKTETISSTKLIEFLNEKQRDARLNQILYPEYDTKRILEIITKYEPDQENINKKECSREGLVR